MRHFAPVVFRVEKNLVARVKRVLCGKGTLNVQKGQEVTPDVILGNSTASVGFRIVNLCTELQVSSGEAEKLLIRKMGQRIYKGELLAYKKGWFLSQGKTVVSPADGILDFFNSKTGELKISFFPKKVDLPAGLYGVVEEVDPQRGHVVIRTVVDKVLGIFGSGKPRDGILHIIGRSDELISKTLIVSKYNGYILAGGSLFCKDTITAAISVGINGIIAGGIDAVDFKGMAGSRLAFPKKLDSDLGVSMVICEGFGSVPLASDIYGILSKYEGKFVFIDGNKAVVLLPLPTASCMAKVKSTILPPEEKEYESRISELTVGCKVRIVGSSYLGEQGVLKAINSSRTILHSGLKTFLATVETSRRKLQVPVANLEVIM